MAWGPFFITLFIFFFIIYYYYYYQFFGVHSSLYFFQPLGFEFRRIKLSCEVAASSTVVRIKASVFFRRIISLMVIECLTTHFINFYFVGYFCPKRKKKFWKFVRRSAPCSIGFSYNPNESFARSSYWTRV